MDERICAARLRAAYLFPYFSSGLFALIPIETDDLSRTAGQVTMGVDKRWRMIYNSGIFDQWSINEIASVMVHEVMHLLRDHPIRSCVSSQAEHMIWNLAADCEINDDIKDIKLPKGVIYPKETFGFDEGLMAEEYFKLLMDKAEEIKQQIPNPTVGGGACGGCATGEGDDESVPEGDGTGSVQGVTGKEVEVIKNTVAKDIQDYARSKGRGSIPGGFERWADDMLRSTVPWRTILNGCIRGMIGETQGMVNYTYSRPARRQSIYGKIIMPSLRAPKPNVAVQIDTSGSMSNKDLAHAIGEVDGILKGLAVDVTVISNDSSVGHVQKVKSRKQISLVGGGGTNMGPGIEAAAQLKPRPDFLVIVSDCDADWGKFIPKFPVIVVKVGSYNCQPPDWVKRCIQVEED
jgi:predicted metal-dependent peptidase